MDEDKLKKRFKEEFWVLNPNGNFMSAYAFLRSAISQQIIFDQKLIDFDFILKRYKDHLLKYDYDHGHKSKDQLQYIKSVDRLKDIETFIQEQAFKNSYQINRSSRDKYLFQYLSLNELTKSLRLWKGKIEEKKKHI